MRTAKANTGAPQDIPDDVRDVATLLPILNERLRRLTGGQTTVNRTTVIKPGEGGGGGVSITYRKINADSEQLGSELSGIVIVLVDTSGGPVVFRLRDCVEVRTAVIIAVKKTTADGNAATVKAAEGQNIDGSTEVVLSQPKACWVGGACAVS